MRNIVSNFLNYVNNEQYFENMKRLDKDKTLIVDGCSMAGQWNENGNGEGGDIGLYFSEKWDFNRIGLNFPGKSNCSIFRDITTFLLNYCGKDTLSYKNLLLIVSWTGLTRYSYFDREKMGWMSYTSVDSHNKLHPAINLDYHSIIEEYMNRFLYQISIANLCENLGVNYIMYNAIEDVFSYKNLNTSESGGPDTPPAWIKRIKSYLDMKKPDVLINNALSNMDHHPNNIYDDFDNLYEVLSTKNFMDIPCTGYFGYETGKYKWDWDRIKKYTFDDLHLNKLGYQEWAKVLEDFIIDKGMGDFIK